MTNFNKILLIFVILIFQGIIFVENHIKSLEITSLPSNILNECGKPATILIKNKGRQSGTCRWFFWPPFQVKIIRGGSRNTFKPFETHVIKIVAVEDTKEEGKHIAKLNVICNPSSGNLKKFSKRFKIFDPNVKLSFAGSRKYVVTEGGNTKWVILHATKGNGQCSWKVKPKKQIKISEGGKINKFQTGDVHLLELTAVDDDKIEGLHFGKLEVICNKGTYTERKYEKVIKIRDNDLEGSGTNDPHFSQAIFDPKTNDIKFLCYDITGKPGKILKIFTHFQAKISLEGELQDDYYMHIIRIITIFGNITITTSELLLPDNTKFRWSSSTIKDSYDKDFYEISMFKNTFEIVIERENKENEYVKFSITRHYHSVIGKFLNVQIIGLKDYRNIGGIFGRVGNNYFEFNDPIQDNFIYNENRRGSVLINRHIFPSIIKQKQENLCWYLNIEDLLHPLTVEDFLNPNELNN